MTVNNSGRGEIATFYHSGNLRVLSQSVQSMRRGKVCSLCLTCFCSLGSFFVADVIHLAVEGFISPCGGFPLHTALKAGAVVEENGACRSPGTCLPRNEQYHSHPGFAGDLPGPAILVSDNGDMGCTSDTNPAEALPASVESFIHEGKLEGNCLGGKWRGSWFGCRGCNKYSEKSRCF